MTTLEDLKAGRLVVVPREATPDMVEADLDYHERKDVIRLGRPLTVEEYQAAEYRAMLTASPDHTTALLSLVEGMERERAACMAVLLDSGPPDHQAEVLRIHGEKCDWMNRALAAEAKVDVLRGALGEIVKADTHLVWSGGSVPEPSHDELGACAQIAARALTEKNNG